MTVGLDLDFDYSSYAQYSNSSTNLSEPSHIHFHQTILAEKPSLNFSRIATQKSYYSSCEDRTNGVYIETVGGRAGGWSAEGGATWSWGGEGEIAFDTFMEGKIYDDDGNQAHVRIQQGDNGRGRADVSGKCEGRYGNRDKKGDHDISGRLRSGVENPDKFTDYKDWGRK